MAHILSGLLSTVDKLLINRYISVLHFAPVSCRNILISILPSLGYLVLVPGLFIVPRPSLAIWLPAFSCRCGDCISPFLVLKC